MTSPMIPRDLELPPDAPAELVAEAAEVGAYEIELLIRYGDPLEHECCCTFTRLRHCDHCHTEDAAP